MKDVLEVNYGRKVHEKWRNIPFLGKFQRPVPVQVRNSPPKPNLYRYRCGIASRTEPVPVQVRAVPVQVVLCFSISTSIRILAITFSFLTRFE